jgi:hypothetical protein
MWYAQTVADMIRPPVGQTRYAILMSALDRLEQEVAQASNYPYRDSKPYRARICFHALFGVADALGAIDRVFAERIAAWLPTAPGFFTPQLTAIIARLSRIESCHDASLRLAAHTEQQILLDTDISTRVSSYGALARAVWRVSTEESAAYFRRTLDLADAIGSDDFDRTNHLLEVTSYYAGPELSPAAGHTLGRILELNQNEDSKFPWIEYARTMVPVAGLATLAMIARLDDRGKARFGLSLGPALTALIQSGKLSGDVATCLIGLVAPIETWTWNSTDFAAVALVSLPVVLREWFFATTLVEIDRDDQLAPSRATITALLKLAQTHLPQTSPSFARLAALAARRGPEEAPQERMAATQEAMASPVDLGDPQAIDRAILGADTDQSGRRWPQRTISQLAHAVTTPAKRLAFVKAVVGANAATLSDKLRALDDFLPVWASLSAALKDTLPEQALILAAKHAGELIRSQLGGWTGWRGLINDFHGVRPKLVERVVMSLGALAGEISGDSWLALAVQLAADVSPSALATALERFLMLSDATLPAEVGDGPWDSRFALNDDPVDVAAGLIWSRLGHRSAAMRWRAAHAVLRLAAIERFDIINRLVARYDTASVIPFGDVKLPPYPLHARLWLLIALARIAADRPIQMSSYLSLFERIAFADDFPHLIIRSFAIDALRAIAPRLDPSSRGVLDARLAGANISPFAHKPTDGIAEARYVQRPEKSPRPSDAFHLDYDFTKYQVQGVCDVFGCGGWEVEDRITHWVRRWDRTVDSMHACPRGRGDDDDAWSSGYIPDIDRYGSYLGWHALMLTAGDMLQSRVVTGRDWRGDAWAAFLGDYRLSRADGRWLAEATELFPLDLPRANDVPMPEGMPKRSEREDNALLMPMLGIANGALTGGWMPVNGRWSLPNDSNATLATVLVAAEDAPAVLMTLLTDEKFFRWLPHDEDEIERHFGREGHCVREWIVTMQNSERHLDRHDPYAFRTAMQRSTPALWVCERLGLMAKDPIIMNWSEADGPAFRAEAWGAEGGRGQDSWDDSGERISIERSHLLRLLDGTEMMLVGSLKLQRYHKTKSAARDGDTSPFTHRSLVFSQDQNGRVETPLRAAAWARTAVAALEESDRRDFRNRFDAIITALRARRR